jgi:mannose-1-phosphate guanylyltransferase
VPNVSWEDIGGLENVMRETHLDKTIANECQENKIISSLSEVLVAVKTEISMLKMLGLANIVLFVFLCFMLFVILVLKV